MATGRELPRAPPPHRAVGSVTYRGEADGGERVADSIPNFMHTKSPHCLLSLECDSSFFYLNKPPCPRASALLHVNKLDMDYILLVPTTHASTVLF